MQPPGSSLYMLVSVTVGRAKRGRSLKAPTVTEFSGLQCLSVRPRRRWLGIACALIDSSRARPNVRPVKPKTETL